MLFPTLDSHFCWRCNFPPQLSLEKSVYLVITSITYNPRSGAKWGTPMLLFYSLSFPSSPFYFFSPFIFISWRLVTLQYCSYFTIFTIHWHESAMDLHVFPIPIPPPTYLSIPSLWVFTVHQPWALVSIIPLLKIFIYLVFLGLSSSPQDLQPSLWHVGSSSLTRDGTLAPCIGSLES